MAKYKFKEGFEYVFNGGRITNEDLSDDVAIHLLSKGRVKLEDFDISEEATEQQEIKQEVKQIKKTKTKN
jgi:hypothetical protein